MLTADDILFLEEPHSYIVKGKRFESVTQKIRAAGLGDDFSAVPPMILAQKQLFGKHVHMACQYYDEGTLDMRTVYPAIQGYVQAYIKFRNERVLRVIAVEERMAYIPLKLAGTPDLVCFMGGRRVVIDRKTSQHMSPSMGLQTFGYKFLWEMIYPNQMIYGRYGLRLSADGNYRLIPHMDPDDEIAFLDVLGRPEAAERMPQWINKYGPRPN